jgi:hypothetical protein
MTSCRAVPQSETCGEFSFNHGALEIESCPPSKPAMQMLGLCLLVQLFLAFGVAGLLWPEKFMPLFGVLMFPWQANSRIIRANGMLAIAAYLVIVATLVIRVF